MKSVPAGITGTSVESVRCVHVMHAEKFIGPFIDFVADRFGAGEHLFLVRHCAKFPMPLRANVVVFDERPGRWRKLRLLAGALHGADRIFLHSLFYEDVLLLLLLMPWTLKRCYWLIWGADLYTRTRSGTSLRARISEWLRRQIVHRVGHLVTYIPGDVDLARRWYEATGRYEECLLYPSNASHGARVASERVASSFVNVLVGNSADPTNDHDDAFRRLLPLMHERVRIYCPLSYGDPENALRVKELGRRMFGDQFIAMTEFLTLDQYQDFLASVDVAVFSHHRQQGLGNMIQLLALGKKVFMRKTVTQYEMFRGLGIAVFDLEGLSLGPDAVADREIHRNRERVAGYFNLDTLERQYRRLFA